MEHDDLSVIPPAKEHDMTRMDDHDCAVCKTVHFGDQMYQVADEHDGQYFLCTAQCFSVFLVEHYGK